MKNILLVEDDPEITNLLNLHFDANQYILTSCALGKDAVDTFNSKDFNLVILDITLPDANGLEICKTLRKQKNNTPILVLTCRGDESDKVLALELGADDYVTKPFGLLELFARIKALLRRAENHYHHEPKLLQKNEIVHKNLVVNIDKRKISIKDKRLDLTPKEFELLLLLASNPGKTFSRNELLEQVWGYAFSGYEHTITSHINRLRIKIETDLNHPEYILTSWGSGYRFSE